VMLMIQEAVLGIVDRALATIDFHPQIGGRGV
jgi:hypothetical protein